jgi:hypothetical protein
MKEFSAGKFVVTCWDGGYPVWCQIKYDGEEIARGIHHGEIADLIFSLTRMQSHLRFHPMLKDRHHEV